MTSLEQDTAFDTAPYELPIPKVDGLKADKIRVSFTGTLDLNPYDSGDLEWFDSLKLGREFSLPVEATCVSKPQAFTPSEDGPGATTVQVTLKVHTVRR